MSRPGVASGSGPGSEPALEPALERMAQGVRALALPDPLVVGIHTGGVWVAQRLCALLGWAAPATLDVSFYRDDLARAGLPARVRASTLPDLDGRALLLVDDVLYTGRTVAGARRAVRLRPPGAGAPGGAGGPRRARTADPPGRGGPDARHAARHAREAHRPGPAAPGTWRRPVSRAPLSQYDANGRLRHLLTIDGLRRYTVEEIFSLADSLVEVGERSVKKVPLLRGKTAVLLFFEASTRTRTTFEIGAKRLSADVVTLDVAASSTRKGESLLDTVATLRAMHCELFVVRHADSGHLIARHLGADASVVSAGDGCHSHPTQALLDLYTLRAHRPDLAGLKVAIGGDILHSRVARCRWRRCAYGRHRHSPGRAADAGAGGARAPGGRVCHTLKTGLETASTWCWGCACSASAWPAPFCRRTASSTPATADRRRPPAAPTSSRTPGRSTAR